MIQEEFFISRASQNVELTLPAPSASYQGATFKFIIKDTHGSRTVTIKYVSSILYGILNNGGTISSVTASSQIQFSTTSKIGDYANFSCDGTNWYLDAVSSHSSGVA